MDQHLRDRMAALAGRIDASLVQAQHRSEPPPSPTADVQDLLRAREDAESQAKLQALRCAALEDRIAELEAALVGASSARARAEALAEDAKREASAALDALDAQRGVPTMLPPTPSSELPTGSIGEAFQAKLLEIERLSHERDNLRRSADEWRTRARKRQRERDELVEKQERAQAQLSELRERDETNRKHIAELERLVSEQRRELETAERRTEHLRRHLDMAPR